MLLSKDMETIILDHGTGGLLSQDLVTNVIASNLGDRYLGIMEDSAVFKVQSQTLAMTTDSFVVDPIFFKNGDIGKIAICGTVNDLAVSGATPCYLTLGIILEEGFPMKDFIRILRSIKETAIEANIYIVAGDTKVVKKNELDKIYLNTSGIGVFSNTSPKLTLAKIEAGDDIIITGMLGNHSIHILSMREGLGYENNVLSDCAPLNHMIAEVIKVGGMDIKYMRDLTRGGLGSALNEISDAIHKELIVNQCDLPIMRETQMAADMLGINPLYLANEGCLSIICKPNITSKVLNTLHKNKYGINAVKVGFVTENNKQQVTGLRVDGTSEIIEHLYGQELPRLC
ncbi:hydrogenase expression/formation protein HypE [Candidatus Roizmanbacteria bacterium]|nr:hydrogenase expression/formation protein HypE [Candidatus Roizmanbacteria bacterium]